MKNSFLSPLFTKFLLFFALILSPVAKGDSGSSLELFDFHDANYPGGFSGLFYLGKNKKNNEMRFLTHFDQGPKGVRRIGEAQKLLVLETNTQKKTISIVSELPLKDPKGKPLQNDDVDLEGITVDDQGFRWMCEESVPSILKFDKDGKLLKRYIPKDALKKPAFDLLSQSYGSNVLVEALPEVFSKVKSGRGFEGIAYSRGKIYASLQKPIGKEDFIRMLEFDIASERTTGEYNYPLIIKGVGKIGDLAFSPDSNELFMIEQNSKGEKKGKHFLSKARPGQDINMIATQVLNLNDLGYGFAEKVEGLTYVEANTFAVLNDNDFEPETRTALGILRPSRYPDSLQKAKSSH